MSRFRLAFIGCALLAQACNLEEDDRGAVLSCDRFQLTPVLFVHGSGLNSSSWAAAKRDLRTIGYPEGYMLALDLVPNDGDNFSAAETQIAKAMSELLETVVAEHAQSGCSEAAPSKGALVTHSMGAVSGRWFAARVAPEKVVLLVTIAGSNHGTNALCGHEGDGNRQMCPAHSDASGPNEIQTVLNGTDHAITDETPFGIGQDSDPTISIRPGGGKRILYLTIRIEPDEWIEPAESATLDGAGGANFDALRSNILVETTPGNFLFLKPVIHDQLPSDPDVIRFLTHLLMHVSD